MTNLDYRCNLCGTLNNRPAAELVREALSCSKCESSGRLRALAWLISDELFGTPLAMPDFPTIRGWTGMGMSDIDDFAAPLAARFSYSNTYYHKPPLFDVTRPDASLEGQFDFIISSEVLEHVPDPVAPAFDTLYKMLKPDGVLFLTVPYSLQATTVEHFPDLHDFAVTALRDQWVLVNRTRDGRLQTYDNLVFHGGPGSTLEMRVFNEAALRGLLKDAGFQSIRIAGESYPEFGILPDDPWSLPIAARKGGSPSHAWKELAGEYAATRIKLRVTEVDLAGRNADYQRHVEWAESKIAELERESGARLDWGHKIEGDAAQSDALLEEVRSALGRINDEFEERTNWALALQKENENLTGRIEAYDRNRWLKLGRRLGVVR